MRSFDGPIVVEKRLEPPHAGAICTSQTAHPGEPLHLDGTETHDIHLNGRVAILDTARRVQVLSSAGTRERKITLFGHNSQDAPICEELEFPPGSHTQSSFFDYKIITRVLPDHEPWSGHVEVGTNTTGSTAPQIMAHYQAIFNIGFDVTVDGTANCSIEATRNIAYAVPYIYAQGHRFMQPKAHWFNWVTLENITAERISDIDSPINAWRLTVHSGNGLCTARAIPIGLRT